MCLLEGFLLRHKSRSSVVCSKCNKNTRRKHTGRNTHSGKQIVCGGVWLKYKGANGAQVKPIKAQPPITVEGNKFRQAVWMICA